MNISILTFYSHKMYVHYWEITVNHRQDEPAAAAAAAAAAAEETKENYE